jgi:hypothetical protein
MFTDSKGLQIDWGQWVITNPQVLLNFSRLNAAIDASGIPDDCFTLRVTGEDRYRDPANPNVHQSATPPYDVIPSSDRNSPHLIERGARAIDFTIVNNQNSCHCKPVTDSLVDGVLKATDFTPENTRRDYPNAPHTHLNLPPMPIFNTPTWE